MSSPILSLQNIHKKYAGNHSFALADVSFEVEQGKVIALLGESGSGKTTLLRLIAGFESLNEGNIRLAGEVVASPKHILPPEKRGIGMVFQDYALFPHFTIYENIAYGLQKMDKSSKKERVQEVLALVELHGLEKRYPHELSGGQQQRVALARALAPKPHLLLLDEPFSNLDEGLKAQVRRDLKQILQASQTTAIFVTHDTQDALSSADEIVLLKDGCIQQIGSPKELYYQPANQYVANYFGQVNWVEGKVAGGQCQSLLGNWAVNAKLKGNYLVGIRPQYLHLATPEQTQSSFEAKVISQTFLGSYQELQLETSSSLRLEAHLSTQQHFNENTSNYWHCANDLLILIPLGK